MYTGRCAAITQACTLQLCVSVIHSRSTKYKKKKKKRKQRELGTTQYFQNQVALMGDFQLESDASVWTYLPGVIMRLQINE